MANTICHFEFVSSDPAKSREFYGKIFNWTFNADAMPGYTMVDTGGMPGAGIMAKPGEAPIGLNVYIEVDSIEETTGKIRAAGGKVLFDKTPIPNVGHWAMFTDPDGICVGIFEGLKK